MRKTRWLSLIVLLLVSAAMVTPGCGPKKQSFVVALEAEPTSLDPFNATDGVSSTVQQTMFEGLLTFGANNEIVPQLSESFKLNDDCTAITFKLRKGIKFHDGSDLDANVVKKNLDFARNPDNGMARRGFFSFIKDVVVDDNYSVTITSTAPNSAMAAYLAHPAAALKSGLEIDKKLKDAKYDLNRTAVGTGPFVLGEWVTGQQVKVVPFKGYWDKEKAAKVESIVFRPVTEASTRVNMLKTNEAQYVSPLPTGQAQAVSNEKSIEVFSGPSMQVFYIGINLKLAKYSDVRVRHAMNYAINKDQLIAQVANGYGQVADSAIAPSVYGYAKQTVYGFDQAKAKALLTEAGYPNGFDATIWTRNDTQFVAIAEYVKMQLAEVGIKATVQAYEAGTMFDMLDSGTKGTDLWIGRWSPGTGEADWGLRPNFASECIPPSTNNSGFYVNPAVDKLFDEALSASNPAVALQKYAEAQRIIYQEAPWVFLHVPENVVAKRVEVQGIKIIPGGTVILTGAYFGKK